MTFILPVSYFGWRTPTFIIQIQIQISAGFWSVSFLFIYFFVSLFVSLPLTPCGSKQWLILDPSPWLWSQTQTVQSLPCRMSQWDTPCDPGLSLRSLLPLLNPGSHIYMKHKTGPAGLSFLPIGLQCPGRYFPSCTLLLLPSTLSPSVFIHIVLKHVAVFILCFPPLVSSVFFLFCFVCFGSFHILFHLI